MINLLRRWLSTLTAPSVPANRYLPHLRSSHGALKRFLDGTSNESLTTLRLPF
jgi:hypothetical protein